MFNKQQLNTINIIESVNYTQLDVRVVAVGLIVAVAVPVIIIINQVQNTVGVT
jgi:hypothetical protein